MDVYSPSHPTDQDMDVETPADIPTPTEEDNLRNPPMENDSLLTVPSTDNNMGAIALLVSDSAVPGSCSVQISGPVDSAPCVDNSDSNDKNPSSKLKLDKDSTANTSISESDKPSKDKPVSQHRSSEKSHHTSRHSVSRSSRNRSRTPPKRRRDSKSPERRSRRRSSSHSRRRHSHGRRRSRSRDRRRRRSPTPSRSRRPQKVKDTRRFNRSRSSSRNHVDRHYADGSRTPTQVPESGNVVAEMKSPQATLKNYEPSETAPINIVEECWNASDEIDEPGTPNITEELPADIRILPNAQNPGVSFAPTDNFPPGLAAAFMFQNRPPLPHQASTPDFMAWRQPNPRFTARPNPPIQTNESASFMQNPFSTRGNFQGRFSGQNFYHPREVNPGLIGQRPTNSVYPITQGNRLQPPPQPHILAMNGVLNPLMPPVNMAFSNLLSQPPPPPSLPPHLSCAYTAPPPPPLFQPYPPPPPIPPQVSVTPVTQPFIHGRGDAITPNPHCQSSQENVDRSPRKSRFDVPLHDAPPSNLLETLMSKAGLPTDSLGRLGASQRGSLNIPFPESVEDKSPMKKISSLINSAASTLISHMTEAQKAIPNDAPPPPPPPPLPSRPGDNGSIPSHSMFIPPPLPSSSFSNDDERIAANGATTSKSEQRSKSLPNYDVQEMMLKRTRAEFASHRDWQERIALEVRRFIKPSYAAGKISKEEWREILKKSVTNISRSGCKSINTKKIGKFVKLYLQKYYKRHKMLARMKAAEAQGSTVQ